MTSRKVNDSVLVRLAEMLERLPMSPWWWLARWRRRDRQSWIRHVQNHYGATRPEQR